VSADRSGTDCEQHGGVEVVAGNRAVRPENILRVVQALGGTLAVVWLDGD